MADWKDAISADIASQGSQSSSAVGSQPTQNWQQRIDIDLGIGGHPTVAPVQSLKSGMPAGKTSTGQSVSTGPKTGNVFYDFYGRSRAKSGREDLAGKAAKAFDTAQRNAIESGITPQQFADQSALKAANAQSVADKAKQDSFLQNANLDLWDISSMYGNPSDYTPEAKKRAEENAASEAAYANATSNNAIVAKAVSRLAAAASRNAEKRERAEAAVTEFNNRYSERGNYGDVYGDSLGRLANLEAMLADYEKRLDTAKKDYGRLWDSTQEGKTAYKMVTDIMAQIAQERAIRDQAQRLMLRDEDAAEWIKKGSDAEVDLVRQHKDFYETPSPPLENEESLDSALSFLNPEDRARRQAEQHNAEVLAAHGLRAPESVERVDLRGLGTYDAIHPTGEWSEEQHSAYLYLLGKFGADAAGDYAAQVNADIKAGKRAPTEQAFDEWFRGKDAGTWGKIGRGLIGVGAGTAALFTKPGDYIEMLNELNLTGHWTGRENPSFGDKADIAVGARGAQINEEHGTWDLPVVGEKGLGDLYQLLPSMAQSLATGGMGEGATAALFFFSGAESALKDALESGASSDEAVYYSLLCGVAEGAFEELSIDKVLGGDWGGSFIGKVLRDSGIEASEEFNTEVFDKYAGELAARITGNRSMFDREVQRLVDEGMDLEDARHQVFSQYASDVAWASFSGGLSGGMHSLVTGNPIRAARNYLVQRQINTSAAKAREAFNRSYSTAVNAVQEQVESRRDIVGVETAARSAARAQGLSEEQANAVASAAADAARAAGEGGRADTGGDAQPADIATGVLAATRNLSLDLTEQQEQNIANTVAAAAQNAAQSAAENAGGMSGEQARELAEAIVTSATGGVMTERQEALANQNREIFEQLRQELSGENRAAWARDLLLTPREAITGGAGENKVAAGGGQTGRANPLLDAFRSREQEAQAAQAAQEPQDVPAPQNAQAERNAPEASEAAAEPVTQETPEAQETAAQSEEIATEPTPAEPQPQGDAAREQTATQRAAEIQARLDEINDVLDADTEDIETTNQLMAEGERLYQELRSLADDVTQETRISEGQVSAGYGTAENHIDRRTPSGVASREVKPFQFDHPQLHTYYVEAANMLVNEVLAGDVAAQTRPQKQRGSRIKGPVRRLMDLGMSKPRILECLDDIMQDNGQENYADAKRVELVMNDMLTNGWNDHARRFHEPNASYIAAKDAIAGGITAGSWEKYLKYHELSIIDGLATEESLRAEWEKLHPEQKKTAAPVATEAAEGGLLSPDQKGRRETADRAQAGPDNNVQQRKGDVNKNNTEPEKIVQSAQTTAERTNGQGPERERNMSRNLRGNEKAEPELRESFEQNRDLYRQLTNAEVARKAEEIVGRGYEAARDEIYKMLGQAKAGAKFPPEYAVAGYHLANEMVRRGETERARELCSDISAELTYAGQVGQIGKLILESDPSVRIRTVNKLIDRLNEKLSDRQKAKNASRGVGTEGGEITVSSEALQRYANAETDEEADAALEDIKREIAAQIPATVKDKFTALRYLNMLGNLKTQGRNLVGNGLMLAATNVKYLNQHVAELAAAAASGGQYQMTTALNVGKMLKDQAMADFDANRSEIKGERRYTDVSRAAQADIYEHQTIFGSGENSEWASDLVSRITGRDVEVKKNILENWRLLTNWAMDIGDEIFMRQVYVRSFAGFLKARGFSDMTQASAETVSAAREYAKREAQEATFHDSNTVSDFVSGFLRGPNTPALVRTIGEGIAPFRKTPANVAVRAVEYSPLGFLQAASKAAKGADLAEVINSSAKAMTGTALFIAGMLARAAGRARARGNPDDDKLTAFEKTQGAMDYSVEMFGRNVSLSQFAPAAIPLFMGVRLQELIEYSDEPFSADSLKKIAGVVTDPMLEMSMLSGLNDFLSDLSNVQGDTDATVNLVLNAMLSYATQGLTNTLIGQFEQASEKNRQTIYTDTRSSGATALDRLLGGTQYRVGQAFAKIPGIDYHQQDYVDAWGRTQSNGGAGERYFNALLNPTFTSGDRSTDVDEELTRLYNDNKGKDGFPDVFPQKRSRSQVIGDGIVMTPEEYLEYSRDSGQRKLSLVREFMHSGEYKGLSDEQRAETIHNLYAFADAMALQKVRDQNGVTTQSDYAKLLAGVDKPGESNDIPALDEKNAGEYIMFDTSYKTAVKAGDYSGIDNLLARYSRLDRNTQAVIAAKNPDGINNLLKYSQAGASSRSYYTIKDSISEAQADLDKNSSQGGDVQMLGLANADIPEEEKERLVDSGAFSLTKGRKTAYDILRGYGYTLKDAYDWFSTADANGDGTLTVKEANAAIARGKFTATQQNELYKRFKAALSK